MFEVTIAPTVSEIVSAIVTPAIVKASVSKVPSTSTSPDISKLAAATSPAKAAAPAAVNLKSLVSAKEVDECILKVSESESSIPTTKLVVPPCWNCNATSPLPAATFTFNPADVIIPEVVSSPLLIKNASSTFKVLLDKVTLVPADKAVLDISIAAEPLTSALTITPEPIAAVPLEILMSPLIPLSM